MVVTWEYRSKTCPIVTLSTTDPTQAGLGLGFCPHVCDAMLRACLTSCCANGDTSRRLRLKCDDTRAETRSRLSAKRTSPFKSAVASFQSTTGSRGVRISCSNAAYTIFRGSVKSTGYPSHSPVSPSLFHPGVTVCHHISTELYPKF